jgi:hypothetical protein
MRRSVGLLLMLVTAFVLSAAPAAAITKNFSRDFEHPFVGLITFWVPDDGNTTDLDSDPDFGGRCSGSLLSPTVFLTAGHCTDESAGDILYAIVYFQQDAGVHYDPATELDPVSGYPEFCATGTLGVTCATASTFFTYGSQGLPNTKDLGIVILDQAITLSEYGQLPEPGTLDSLATQRGLQDVTFTVSGYGISYSSPVGFVSFRERLMGQETLVNLRSAINDGFNLQTSGNGDGRAGTCSGDSGGPVFYPADSNVIMAVTSFGIGNEWCRGTDFAYRIDTADALAWIQQFL